MFFVLGGATYAAAVVMIVKPNEISPGGATGIAALLNVLFAFPIGTAVLLLNLPLLWAGFRKYGGVFILKTAIATVTVSVLLDVFAALLPPLHPDPVLAAVFGGVLMGFGLSLVMLRGATTGGMDIVAKLINRRFPQFTVGRVMLVGDAVIVLLSALVYRRFESALYSVVALYASSRVMDGVLYGADRGKILYIVTDAPEAAAKAITQGVRRGVTLLEAVGGYTGRRRRMLMCTVRSHETFAVLKLMKTIDPKAFITVGEAGEIIGEGFKKSE